MISMRVCKECDGIRRGLLELVELSRRSKPVPNATPHELAEWFDQRDQDADRRIQERTALVTLKGRLIEHQKLTGHHITLPISLGGAGNLN
jgi:hypothetical protein